MMASLLWQKSLSSKKAHRSASIAQEKKDWWQTFSLSFFSYCWCPLYQIRFFCFIAALARRTSGWSMLNMDPTFTLYFAYIFIQDDHSACNYLKMSQKKYSRILNKWMSFYFTTVRMQSVSFPNLACQACVIVYYFPFSSFGEFIPRLSVGTSAPSNIKAVPLSSLSLPWRSSENSES